MDNEDGHQRACLPACQALSHSPPGNFIARKRHDDPRLGTHGIDFFLSSFPFFFEHGFMCLIYYTYNNYKIEMFLFWEGIADSMIYKGGGTGGVLLMERLFE